MVAKPCHLLKVNSLRDNWPLERDFGDFRLKAGQQLHFKKGAEAGNSGDNRLGERQLTIDIVAEGGGFEPPKSRKALNDLANRRLQPLGHPSAREWVFTTYARRVVPTRWSGVNPSA
jgi:hypothetical protein